VVHLPAVAQGGGDCGSKDDTTDPAVCPTPSGRPWGDLCGGRGGFAWEEAEQEEPEQCDPREEDDPPGVAVGDHVVVVNAAKLGLSEKRLDTKNYYKHSGYPGGLKTVGLREQIATHPDRVIRAAVWGMLPHNKLGRQLIKRLKVYGGAEHPHTAQTPEPVAK